MATTEVEKKIRTEYKPRNGTQDLIALIIISAIIAVTIWMFAKYAINNESLKNYFKRIKKDDESDGKELLDAVIGKEVISDK